MPKTKIVLEGFLPTTSYSRASDFLTEVRKVCEAHKFEGLFITNSGPFPDSYTEGKSAYDQHQQAGRHEDPRADEGRERARAAAEDFGDEAGDDGRGPEGDPGTGKRTRKPRSDAGKPRGPRGGRGDDGAGEAGSGSSAGQREHRGEDRAEAGPQRSRGDGDGPAPARGERGQRPGQGADGRPRGGGRGDGHADDRNEQAAPVADDWDEGTDEEALDPEEVNSEEGEDWWAKTPGDEWPDSLTPEKITRETISELMSEHFRATGGKAKKLTLDLVWAVCKVDKLAAVSERDFRPLAKALLKDAARYRHGIKAATKAA